MFYIVTTKYYKQDKNTYAKMADPF